MFDFIMLTRLVHRLAGPLAYIHVERTQIPLVQVFELRHAERNERPALNYGLEALPSRCQRGFAQITGERCDIAHLGAVAEVAVEIVVQLFALSGQLRIDD